MMPSAFSSTSRKIVLVPPISPASNNVIPLGSLFASSGPLEF
jgi:hypothetical protein